MTDSMMGSGSAAHAIETDNGYICSRCRESVSPNATACPHCGRDIYPTLRETLRYLLIFFGPIVLIVFSWPAVWALTGSSVLGFLAAMFFFVVFAGWLIYRASRVVRDFYRDLVD